MRRIDDWLIDSVFQPFADRLPARVSCYGIAAFLLTGFGMEQIAYCALRQEWVALGFLLMWMPSVTHAYHLDRQPARNTVPIDRITRFVVRMTCLFILLPCWAGIICFTPDPFDWLNFMAWITLIPAEYLMACRKNPPKEKRAIARSRLTWSVI